MQAGRQALHNTKINEDLQLRSREKRDPEPDRKRLAYHMTGKSNIIQCIQTTAAVHIPGLLT